MIDFYISQAVAIGAAIYMARHDAPVANHFSDKGVDPLTQAKWHSNGFKNKLVIVLGLSLILLSPFSWPAFWLSFTAGWINGAWIFLLFDPVLNIFRKRSLGWDYISEHDGSGRRLIKWFGKGAGEIKAVICAVVIIGLNILIRLIN